MPTMFRSRRSASYGEPLKSTVLQRALTCGRALGALPNAFTINTLELKHCLREAGATPLGPNVIIRTDEAELSVVRILSPRPI